MRKFDLVSAMLGLVLICNIPTTGMAQDHSCGTTERLRELYKQDPQLERDQESFLRNVFKDGPRRAGTRDEVIYTIPIVFHVIHEYGTENISKAQIENQVAILNRDFRKLNADTAAVIPEFRGIIADAHVQFELAKIDPDGNCTDGITRRFSHETRIGDDYSKLDQWPRDKYLNVWVVKSMRDGVAGYAYYPTATSGFLAFADGIIILSNYIGSIGTGTVGNSRALTHEIGHYLALPHTWGSTNDPEQACGDDGVYDTPITKGHEFTCPTYDVDCDNTAFPVSYKFDSVTTTSGTVDPTPLPIPLDSGLLYSNFTANGVAANPASASGRFDYAGWDLGATDSLTVYDSLTGSINLAKYYEFTVTPVFGQKMNITGLNFLVKRDSLGPRTYVVRASPNGYTTNLTASISPANTDLGVQTGNIFFIKNDTNTVESGSKITVSGTGFANTTSPVTFRIYAYNAESATGAFAVDNIGLVGTYGTIENVENYMEYSYCSKMFTVGQAEVMETTLNSPISYRNNLWQPANLTATGVDGALVTCAPVADFAPSFKFICMGDNVTFTSHSWKGAVTSYDWSFPGGTPATSTAAAPVVTYNTAGWHDATLTVTNAAGSSTVTYTQSVYVSNPYVDFVGPHVEGFENAGTSAWYISENPENNDARWQRVNYGAATGSYAFKLNNHKTVTMWDFDYYNHLGGNRDALITPSYNLSGVTGGSITFKYSSATHATLPEQMTENLKIYISVNCGRSWSPLGGASGTLATSELNNGGQTAADYVPPGPSAWTTKSIPLLSSHLQANVRFKFEYIASDYSNNIYIDDININGIVGVEEVENDRFGLSVYPNPTTPEAGLNVSFVSGDHDVTISVLDALGRNVYSTKVDAGQGLVKQLVPAQKLETGMYLISITDGVNQTSKKVIVE